MEVTKKFSVGKPRRFYGEVNHICASSSYMNSVHPRLQKKKKPWREREREKSGDKKLGMCVENESKPVLNAPRASQLLYYTVDLNIIPIATSTGAWARSSFSKKKMWKERRKRKEASSLSSGLSDFRESAARWTLPISSSPNVYLRARVISPHKFINSLT